MISNLEEYENVISFPYWSHYYVIYFLGTYVNLDDVFYVRFVRILSEIVLEKNKIVFIKLI